MDGELRSSPPTPAPLVGVVREGLGVFLALQEPRYRQPDDNTPPMPAVMMTKTVGAGAPRSAADLRPSEWSERYRACVAPLRDDAANALWGLATTVLQLLDDGAAHEVNASAAVCAWYCAFKFDAAYVAEKQAELSGLALRTCTHDEVEQIGIFFLDMIERCFFAGAFGAAASVIESLMAALRGGAEFNPFSDDVESCIANLKRLLLQSYTDERSFAAWRRDANECVFDAKRILLEGGAAGGRGAGAVVSVAASLCTVALNMLLAISGDEVLVQQRCLEAELSQLDYLAALCAISFPFRTLSDLREAMATSAELWEWDVENAWQCRVALELFGVESLKDVVRAMGAVADIAAECLPWDVAEVAALSRAVGASPRLDYSGDDDEDGDDDDDDAYGEIVFPTAVTPDDSPSVRRFILTFMSAHIADACAPAVAAASHEIALTFGRNDCVATYLRLFSGDGHLWKAAATYAAYSPFMNPALLYNILTGVAPLMAVDDDAYLALCAFFRTMLDTASPHQAQLRRLLRERLGDHPTLQQWLDVLDHYRREAYADIHRYAITARFNRGDAAMAAWLAVEAQLPLPFQTELRRRLRSDDALSDACVYSIGEAVQNSFLALDVCPTAELARALHLCAAISEYRRAAAAVAAHRQDGTTPIAAALRSGAWCLLCLEHVLSRVDACGFFFHPTCTLTLVEHGADVILALREIMYKVGMETYANVAAPVLPALQHAFAVCRIHQGPAGLAAELAAKQQVVREKLSRAVETHVL